MEAVFLKAGVPPRYPRRFLTPSARGTGVEWDEMFEANCRG